MTTGPELLEALGGFVQDRVKRICDNYLTLKCL
jgi:hypothetical protein